jgi:hypothetical protein
MKRSMSCAWVPALALFFGCGSSTTTTSNASQFAGTYAASYSGLYTITTPVAQPQAANTETGTFTISSPAAGKLAVVAAFTGGGGVSGMCSGTGDVSGDTATSDPPNQNCTYAVTGGMQTNVNSSTFTLAGNTITDVVTGSFTGTNASGNYGGTFSGTWTLTRQ